MQLEETERNKKLELDRRTREIEREREIQFERYKQDIHARVADEYASKYD